VVEVMEIMEVGEMRKVRMKGPDTVAMAMRAPI